MYIKYNCGMKGIVKRNVSKQVTSTNEISQTTAGICRMRPPKEYRCKRQIARHVSIR
jgi:hypothetical protein